MAMTHNVGSKTDKADALLTSGPIGELAKLDTFPALAGLAESSKGSSMSG
jgi:hypothetical protein